MLERGYSVRLLMDNGSTVPGPDGAGGFSGNDSSDAAGILLDTLAVIDHSEEPGAGLSMAHDVLRAGSEGLLVAFLGDLDEAQAAIVGRMRQRAGGAVAFVLDGSAWTTREPEGHPDVPPVNGGAPDDVDVSENGSQRSVRLLRESGWTVLPVSAGEGLGDLWHRADGLRSDEPREEAGAR
jgi:hypothetical protein